MDNIARKAVYQSPAKNEHSMIHVTKSYIVVSSLKMKNPHKETQLLHRFPPHTKIGHILSVRAVESESRNGLDIFIPSPGNNKFPVWITAQAISFWQKRFRRYHQKTSSSAQNCSLTSMLHSGRHLVANEKLAIILGKEMQCGFSRFTSDLEGCTVCFTNTPSPCRTLKRRVRCRHAHLCVWCVGHNG